MTDQGADTDERGDGEHHHVERRQGPGRRVEEALAQDVRARQHGALGDDAADEHRGAGQRRGNGDGDHGSPARRTVDVIEDDESHRDHGRVADRVLQTHREQSARGIHCPVVHESRDEEQQGQRTPDRPVQVKPLPAVVQPQPDLIDRGEAGQRDHPGKAERRDGRLHDRLNRPGLAAA